MSFQGNDNADEVSRMMLRLAYAAVVKLKSPFSPLSKNNFDALAETLENFRAQTGTLVSKPPAYLFAPKTVASVPKLKLIEHIFEQAGRLNTQEMCEFTEFFCEFGQRLQIHMKDQLEQQKKKASGTGTEQKST